jgi:hypothetical protein
VLCFSPDRRRNPCFGKPIFFLAKKNDQRKFLFWLEKNGFPRQDCRKGQELLQKKNKNVIKKVSRKNSLGLSVLVFVNEIECSTFQGLEVAKLSLGLIPRAFVITNQYF